MNTNDWNLLMDIAFKTQSYRKNFDMISNNENFITECDGTITLMRFVEQKPPIAIGEYGFSVWNIKMGLQYGADFNRLIEEHDCENTYFELQQLITKKKFNIEKYNKLILVHSLVICEEYRKHGITEEFIEFLYRDFYRENDAIITLVLPFQNNPIDLNFYVNNKSVPIRENLGVFNDVKEIPAVEYYSLNKLIDKNDVELNEYKLFSAATKCGLNRIEESHLFIFSPEKTIQRLKEKQQYLENITII